VTEYVCSRCGSDLRLRPAKLTADGRRECLSCTGPRCPVDGCAVRWRSGEDRLCLEHGRVDAAIDAALAELFGAGWGEGD
jgi:hypothetical protein